MRLPGWNTNECGAVCRVAHRVEFYPVGFMEGLIMDARLRVRFAPDDAEYPWAVEECRGGSWRVVRTFPCREDAEGCVKRAGG